MINLLATNDFLGYTSGKILCNDSNSRYTMDQNDTYKIIWIQKGSVKITFNRTNVVLKKNHCLFIDKNASLIINSLDSFQLSYIQFTEPNLVVNHELSLIINNSGLFDSGKVFNRILLKDNYLKIVQHYTDLLLSLQLKKRNLLNKCLGLNTLQQILLLAISSFDTKNDKIDLLNEKVPNKKLIDSFNLSIKENIRNERNVKFYCEELRVDYNILNKICLKTYGVNVKSYLDLKMLSAIKSVLEDTTLAIKEVSDYFNFSDTSNFLRFFKRISNMTISEYRNSFKQKSYDFPINNQVKYMDVSVN